MYISLLYNYFVGYYTTGSQAERKVNPDRNRWRKTTGTRIEQGRIHARSTSIRGCR